MVYQSGGDIDTLPLAYTVLPGYEHGGRVACATVARGKVILSTRSLLLDEALGYLTAFRIMIEIPRPDLS